MEFRVELFRFGSLEFQDSALQAGLQGSYVVVCSAEQLDQVSMLPSESSGAGGLIVEARKLEHGFRRISARIPYSLP